MIRVEILPSIEDNFGIDALLLAMRIDTYVAKDAKTQLSDLLLMVRKHDLLNISLRDNIVKCGNSRLSKEGLDTLIAKSQIGEGLQKVYQVLPVITLEGALILRVSDEGFNHAFSALRCHNTGATVVVNT